MTTSQHLHPTEVDPDGHVAIQRIYAAYGFKLRVECRLPPNGEWEACAPFWAPNFDYRLVDLDTGSQIVWSPAEEPVFERPEADPDGLSAHAPGSKLDAGKPRAHLVLSDFSSALIAVVEVGTYGAEKYTDHGWLSVRDGESRYADAAMRHYLERCQGRDCDNTSGLMHLAHQAWNVLAELELALRRHQDELDALKSSRADR